MALNKEGLRQMVRVTYELMGPRSKIEEDFVDSARRVLEGDQRFDPESLVYDLAALALLRNGFLEQETARILDMANRINTRKADN